MISYDKLRISWYNSINGNISNAIVTVVFVRHAMTKMEPEIHPSKWKLSKVGKDQAHSLSEVLQNLDFVPNRIYTSTEEKTIKTMEPYSETVDNLIFPITQFDELHLPDFYDSIEEFQQKRKLQFENPGFSIQGSERPQNAIKRFKSALVSVIEDDVIICTHGTILSLYLADFNNWSSKKAYQFWKNLPFGQIIDQISIK